MGEVEGDHRGVHLTGDHLEELVATGLTTVGEGGSVVQGVEVAGVHAGLAVEGADQHDFFHELVQEEVVLDPQRVGVVEGDREGVVVDLLPGTRVRGGHGGQHQGC